MLADVADARDVKFTYPNKDLLSYIFDDPPVAPDTPLFIDADNLDSPEGTLTYGQSKSLAQKIAFGLRERGLQDGDVTLVFSPNSNLYPSVIFGIICAGAIFTGANPSYLPDELLHQVTHSKAKFLVVDALLLPMAKKVCAQAGIPDDRILTFKPVPGHPGASIQDLAKCGKELQWKRITDPKVLADKTVILLYSSGTTGKPKGVELTHSNVVSNTHQTQFVRDQGDAYLKSIGEEPLQGPFVGHLPMFHAYGLSNSCCAAFRTGHCFIVTRKFEIGQMLELIQRFKIQALATVPPVITLLAKHTLVDNYDLSSLRSIGSGAAPLGQETQELLRKRIRESAKRAGKEAKPCRFQQGWGMSELCCTGTSFTAGDDDYEGSVGRLVPGLEAKLVDDEGKVVTKAGERGEFCLRGPNIMKGYLNAPEATRETVDSEGWLHTGDIAICSEDGRRWWIVDRKKELIKYKGLQVAPAELESLLLSHDHIADVCVVGVPFEDTEAPRAYVVKSSPSLSEQDVKTFVEGKAARYKWLRGGVIFIDAIPKSASGKILRRELRTKAQQEILAAQKAKL
ncbi:4-coumarate-CoA ligase-like protein [Protomyces lactucae-debilis]|uniref:4-coumarate-CoA ligase-like protein n=1 Tax=Protomyces lactucae-debilis TaxID=2754530 RepID=A0A1Y2FTS0_PROLT|nr:4-coumarate-CoA ligase-like protein [Protomyces lactucae-debilis]ORY86967.1 4-coumarate-CoA ligase-like protein [Protomyces lactucae-debilis]